MPRRSGGFLAGPATVTPVERADPSGHAPYTAAFWNWTRAGRSMRARRLEDLSESEVLALSVASEEEDARILLDMARRLRSAYPATAAMLEGMASEEDGHRRRLLELHGRRFGNELPYVTRRDVRGFPQRRPVWLLEELRVEAVRRFVADMEGQAAAFYEGAARRLLGDLAVAELGHGDAASALEETLVNGAVRDGEDADARRAFVLQVVQPGLAGFIDGSVSTLAPLCAAAMATHAPWKAFLVGMAASTGAGISMGLTEALSDSGEITGRGKPWLRGAVCGVMTALGGLGHTLPFLIPDFAAAMAAAAAVVSVELAAIAYVRWRWMDTPVAVASGQILVGGAVVVLAGSLIGLG